MKRGVILVHVLILVAMMGFIASLTLKWTLSRHMAAKRSVEENENRALLFAAQTKVFSCLSQFTDFPNEQCKTPVLKAAWSSYGTVNACLGGKDVGGRLYNYTLCGRSKPTAIPWPPCRVLFAVCEPGAITCCNPISSCPSLDCKALPKP